MNWSPICGPQWKRIGHSWISSWMIPIDFALPQLPSCYVKQMDTKDKTDKILKAFQNLHCKVKLKPGSANDQDRLQKYHLLNALRKRTEALIIKTNNDDIKKPLIILQKRLSAVYSPSAGRRTDASCFTNVKTQLGRTRGAKAAQTRSMRFTALISDRHRSGLRGAAVFTHAPFVTCRRVAEQNQSCRGRSGSLGGGRCWDSWTCFFEVGVNANAITPDAALFGPTGTALSLCSNTTLWEI